MRKLAIFGEVFFRILKAMEEATFHFLLFSAFRTFGSANALMMALASAMPSFLAMHLPKWFQSQLRAAARDAPTAATARLPPYRTARVGDQN